MKGRGSHLEQHRGIWRAVLRVPRDLVKTIGKDKLRQSLGTGSLAQAEKLKHRVLANWLKMFEDARKGSLPHGRANPRLSALKEQAAIYARDLKAAEAAGDYEKMEETKDFISMTAEQIQGEPIGATEATAYEDSAPVYDPEKKAMAGRFYRMAIGQETLETLLERWKLESDTKQAHKEGVALEISRLPSGFPIKASKREAAKHVSALLAEGVNRATIGNRVRRLSAFWSWLEKKGEAELNPWYRQAPAVREVDRSGRRPWAEAEAAAILNATPEGHLLHIPVRLAMFAGLRADEIAGLSFDGGEWVRVLKGKTKNSARALPRHPAIGEAALKAFCSTHRNGRKSRRYKSPQRRQEGASRSLRHPLSKIPLDKS